MTVRNARILVAGYKFALIEAENANFPVEFMCSELGVSRSGFYAWRGRGPSARALEDQKLAVEVAAAYRSSKDRYGSPRVHAELQAKGHRVGRKRVERLMRDRGLHARPTRQFKRTTLSNHKLPVAPNLLARAFEREAPNQAWVTDITYIRTGEGWLYLIAIPDLFLRRVVGWETSDRLDAAFCRDALSKALHARQTAPGLLVHADQGVQFASAVFRELLLAWEGVLSMSRRGNCWDNAVAERLWSTIKAELTEVTWFPTRAAAREALFGYLETFYNHERRHSRLGYLSPATYARLAITRPMAA